MSKPTDIPERVAERPSNKPDEHIAWLRYVNHGQEEDSGADILTIETCNSDAPGAFKVYASMPVEPDAWEEAIKEARLAKTDGIGSTMSNLGVDRVIARLERVRKLLYAAPPPSVRVEQARAQAFEEAARIAEDQSNIDMVGGSTGNAYGTAKRIAAAIRTATKEGGIES
jgi:hypothetical protein